MTPPPGQWLETKSSSLSLEWTLPRLGMYGCVGQLEYGLWSLSSYMTSFSMFWTVNSLTFQVCMWGCVRVREFGSEGWAGLDLWCAWPLYLLDHNCINVGPSALMLFARYAIDQGCQWVRVMSYIRLMQTQWRGRAHETTEWRTVMHHAN